MRGLSLSDIVTDESMPILRQRKGGWDSAERASACPAGAGAVRAKPARCLSAGSKGVCGPLFN